MNTKKLLSLMLMAMMIVPVTSLSLVSAQNTNDQLITGIIGDLGADRGYTSADKNLVSVVSKTNNTATIEAPVAKQNGQTITKYYITWAPFPYSALTDGTATTDDLNQVKDSDQLQQETGAPIYQVQGEKLVFTIAIDDANAPIYVSIVPEDANNQFGNGIEDFVFTLSTVSVEGTGTTAITAVAGDVNNVNLNRAIVNESCIWDATANRVTLVWDLNLAMSNATRVEISHRGDENVGPMAVKGTPSITDRRFVVDTPHRNIQLFRFKPIDAAGTMVGEEIQYACKPDVSQPAPTPTDPSNPIPVVPETGPAQTALIILFATLIMYMVYRRVKA